MANLQIRNVPQDVHRKLKERAAKLGLSLSEYLLREVEAIAKRPTMEEMLERLDRRERVNPSISPSDIIREERDRS